MEKLQLQTPPERDIFLFKPLEEDISNEILQAIVKINVYDEVQEARIKDYNREAIRLHICTPRWNVNLCFCNL